MTELVITRNTEGKVSGVTERHHKQWLKLWGFIQSLTPGESLYIDFWFPRNAKKHRLHLAVLHKVFSLQEAFTELDEMRHWLQLKAGIVRWVPGKDGQIVALPKSLKFSKMDDAEFDQYHEAVMSVLWEQETHKFLWPHLNPFQAWSMMDIAVNGR